jgi:catechol 2,3-dioxygenase-like lactoylglutathione lyase family enzyme
MTGMIAELVNRFERGVLTRRELIQGLAMLTAAGATASAAPAQDAPIKVVKIDHVSIQVADLPGSIAFYQKMFGLPIVSENKPEKIVRLGIGKTLVSLHDKAPTGLVDHFAIAIENFDEARLTRELQARGVNPQKDIDAGFHIKDPSGIGVQIVGA